MDRGTIPTGRISTIGRLGEETAHEIVTHSCAGRRERPVRAGDDRPARRNSLVGRIGPTGKARSAKTDELPPGGLPTLPMSPSLRHED